MNEWIPKCILTDDFDYNMLTSEEARDILAFVRGDTGEGAIPLGHSVE